MQPSITGGLCVYVSIGHNREPYEMAEPIKVLFGLWTQVGPRNRENEKQNFRPVKVLKLAIDPEKVLISVSVVLKN